MDNFQDLPIEQGEYASFEEPDSSSEELSEQQDMDCDPQDLDCTAINEQKAPKDPKMESIGKKEKKRLWTEGTGIPEPLRDFVTPWPHTADFFHHHGLHTLEPMQLFLRFLPKSCWQDVVR